MKKSPLSTLKGIMLGLIIVAVTYTVLAWTGPTQLPPNGNVPAPINAGTSAQVKNGSLGIGPVATAPFPSTNLDVNGSVRIRGGSPGAGKVLRSDANGLATWVKPTITQYLITATSADNSGSQPVPGNHAACFLGGMSHWDNGNNAPEKCNVRKGVADPTTWNVDTYTQDTGSQTVDGDNLGSLACFVTCMDF